MLACARAALLLLAVPDPMAALGPVPAGAARVYLIRHGQALSNLVPPPPPDAAPRGTDHLTALGESQARKVGAVLAGRGVTLVLTSPAGRARETADKIASTLGLAPVRVETRLRPMDLGTDASGKALSWEDRESVVAVAHGEVIAALVGALTATPPAQIYPPRLANASITVVEARPDGRVALLFSNHVPPGMPSPAP